MKRIKWIVIAVLVVIVLVVAGVWLAIDGIVRRAVETQATSSLNLTTTLGGANVSLLGGRLGLSDLQIVSPQGFAAPRMFTLGGAKVGVTLGHLRSDPVTIDQIVIDKPRLVLEQSNGKFNVQALIQQDSKPTPEGSEPVKLIIDSLTISDAQVVIRPGIPGLQQEVVVPIPSFTVREIGNAEGNRNGAAIKDVVVLLLTEMAEKASKSEALPEDVRRLLEMDLNQVVRQEVDKIAERVGKRVSDELGKEAGKAIEKGIGDLLNKSGKKDEKSPGK